MTTFNNDLATLLKKHNMKIVNAQEALEVGLKYLALEEALEKLEQQTKEEYVVKCQTGFDTNKDWAYATLATLRLAFRNKNRLVLSIQTMQILIHNLYPQITEYITKQLLTGGYATTYDTQKKVYTLTYNN